MSFTLLLHLFQVLPYEFELAAERMQTIEHQLQKTHYLLGNDFTAVDIMCGEVLTIAEVHPSKGLVAGLQSCMRFTFSLYCPS